MKKFLPLLLVLPLLVSGCASPTESRDDIRAQTACVLICKLQLNKNADISAGPCLSNEVIPDWVCDVAHKIRMPVDDRPENQCSAFGKTASHFVEVDLNCDVIRVV